LEVTFLEGSKAILTNQHTGMGDIKQFGTDYMYYQISTLTKDNSIQVVLSVLMVITLYTKTIQLFWLHHIND
jgi:subfamily B ATP-binding cassette protein MsbA